MDQVDQYSYFTLGAALSELEKLRTTDSVKFAAIWFALYTADWALQEFDRSPCIHSKAAARDIRSAIQSIHNEAHSENEDGKREVDFNAEIQPWAFNGVEQAIKDFKSNFARESPTLPIFFLPQKGLARTDQLITNAEMDFAPSVRDSLSRYQRAVEEIQQAGKALAVDLFTARAFHIMRAVELLVLELLKKYDIHPTKAQRNLGSYVKLLEEKKVNAELLRFLNEMVRPDRGLHPDFPPFISRDRG